MSEHELSFYDAGHGDGRRFAWQCSCGKGSNTLRSASDARDAADKHVAKASRPPRPDHLALALAALPTAQCVLWTGGLNRDGYGQHRRVYEAAVGPIPDGLSLDHLCRVRACVNPAHLEPVTIAVNNLRRLIVSHGGIKSGLGWPETTGWV